MRHAGWYYKAALYCECEGNSGPTEAQLIGCYGCVSVGKVGALPQPATRESSCLGCTQPFLFFVFPLPSWPYSPVRSQRGASIKPFLLLLHHSHIKRRPCQHSTAANHAFSSGDLIIATTTAHRAACVYVLVIFFFF